MIPTSTPAINTYIGNGTASAFAITFPTYEEADIVAQIVQDADGATQTLILDTDFSLASIGIPNTNGELTLINAGQAWLDGDGDLATGYTLNIKFTTDVKQPATLRNLGRRAPETIESALDRLAMSQKAVSDLANRALSLPDSDSGIDPTFPPLTGNADKILQVNGDETGFEYGPTATAIFAAEANALAAEIAAEAAQAAAETAQTAAELAETNAEASETAAALSETNAANSEAAAALFEAEAEFWANISLFVEEVDIDVTDTPVTVAAGPDEGKLYRADDSSGNIVVNLPAIGATGVAWKIGVIKVVDSANSIEIVPNGAETINGASSLFLTNNGIGVIIYADSPTDWKAAYIVGAGEGTGGGGSGGGGVVWNNTTQDIGAGGQITHLPNIQHGLFVAGNAGPQTANIAPFAAPPVEDGTLVILIGTSDTNYLVIPFSDTAEGCMIMGDMVLRNNSQLTLAYNLAKQRYYEVSRRD